MKTGKKLALTLGLAAGAVVAAIITGRNGKKSKSNVSIYNRQPGIKLTSDKYDDSEVFYI